MPFIAAMTGEWFFSAHDGDNTGPPEISPAELFKSSVRVKAESMVYGGYNELVNGC